MRGAFLSNDLPYLTSLSSLMHMRLLSSVPSFSHQSPHYLQTDSMRITPSIFHPHLSIMGMWPGKFHSYYGGQEPANKSCNSFIHVAQYHHVHGKTSHLAKPPKLPSSIPRVQFMPVLDTSQHNQGDTIKLTIIGVFPELCQAMDILVQLNQMACLFPRSDGTFLMTFMPLAVPTQLHQYALPCCSPVNYGP